MKDGSWRGALRSRRGLLAEAGATALLATTAGPLWAAEKQAPMTIVVNQSPWFDGFRAAVEAYQKETGNQVTLDVNSFAGSLEKQRAAVRAEQSPFDVLVMNAGFFIEMYVGGFLVPLTEIDSSFKLDREVYTFDDSVFWNPETKRVDKAGQLMSVPINPNIPLLFYRADLYKEKGLKVPETWDELLVNAKALNEPPKRYGIVQRGARGTFDVTYDVFPYLWSNGGDIFKDQKGGDYTITINSKDSLAGFDVYLTLEKEAGHPKTAGQTQANVIQSIVTRQGRPYRRRDRGVAADGRPQQVDRRRRRGLCAAAARARLQDQPAARPLAGRDPEEHPGRSAEGGAGFPRLVPDAGSADDLCQGRRPTDQKGRARV